MGVAAAVDAARLEEAAQIEEWGLVEGGHDIDLSDLKARPDPNNPFHPFGKQCADESQSMHGLLGAQHI